MSSKGGRNIGLSSEQLQYSSFYRPQEFEDVKSVTMGPGDSLMSASTQLYRNLYGSCFNEREKYCVIERPSNELMGTKIFRASLYYFDDKLYKVRYLLSSDVSYKLINSLPRFSIKALSHESTRCLKNEPPVLRLTNKTIF